MNYRKKTSKKIRTASDLSNDIVKEEKFAAAKKVETLDSIAIKYRTDKCSLKHNYTQIYERYFRSLRKENLNLLELGVANGASLRTWKEYFINATIYGFDIRKENLFYDESRIKCFQADQTNRQNLKNATGGIGVEYDIIIDDATHIAQNQITAFETLFPVLKNGGIYVIEDIYNSFINNQGIDQYISKLMHKQHCAFLGEKTKFCIQSIHCYRGIIFIFKNEDMIVSTRTKKWADQ